MSQNIRKETGFTDGVETFKDNYYSDNQYAPMMGSVASSLSSKEEGMIFWLRFELCLSLSHLPDTDRNRGRSRRRSFFRTLKERLSRSKNRSRSVDPGTPGRDDSLNRDDPLIRSVSADRGRSGITDFIMLVRGFNISNFIHLLGQLLAVPGLGGEIDSTRSSLSEVSAISNASTRTYLDEASTLVLESTDNGVKKYFLFYDEITIVLSIVLRKILCNRHYLIPMALAEKRKWKKKGMKLHIFSDHVFVAKHLTG